MENAARNKKQKTERFDHLTAPYAPNVLVSKSDVKVINELAAEIDGDSLSEYIQDTKKTRESQKKFYKEKSRPHPRPFLNVTNDRLWVLINHWHPIVAYGAKIELAQRDFFYFCHLRAPDFYNLSRPHIVRLCRELQEFYEGNETVMIMNLPPRHGKSRTISLFEQWIFGKKSSEKIITGSYNETVSTEFSKSVRNGISEIKGDPDIIVYNDIFPDIHIKRGDAAMNMWTLEGEYSSYLATSPEGTATGFGGSIIVIDDLIKLAKEAFNENLLAEHWKWFTDTLLSRREHGGRFIIIMTRWANNDLAGRAERHFAKEKIPFRVVCMKALLNEETHEMLCPQILSYEDYQLIVKTMSTEIASANYQQIPVDLKGRLYQSFKTYDDIPRDADGKSLFTAIRAYCDTADQGGDYLCNIIYGVYLNCAYVLDVYYTKDGMEITEEETARRLCEFKVGDADIESNNGGRGFARSVQRILKEIFKYHKCVVNWFHQSENKRARILTSATFIQNNIIFPADWQSRWPEYYEAMFKYQKEGKNAHDDAPDATTGVAEHFDKSSVFITILGDDENADSVSSSDDKPHVGEPFISAVKKAFGRSYPGWRS